MMQTAKTCGARHVIVLSDVVDDCHVESGMRGGIEVSAIGQLIVSNLKPDADEATAEDFVLARQRGPREIHTILHTSGSTGEKSPLDSPRRGHSN